MTEQQIKARFEGFWDSTNNEPWIKGRLKDGSFTTENLPAEIKKFCGESFQCGIRHCEGTHVLTLLWRWVKERWDEHRYIRSCRERF